MAERMQDAAVNEDLREAFDRGSLRALVRIETELKRAREEEQRLKAACTPDRVEANLVALEQSAYIVAGQELRAAFNVQHGEIQRREAQREAMQQEWDAIAEALQIDPDAESPVDAIKRMRATIKALADALEEERRVTGVDCQCRDGYRCSCCRSEDALRLAGRLK